MYSKYIANVVLKEYLDKEKLYLKNQNINFMTSNILADYERNNKTIYVVMPTLYDAQKCYDELINMTDESNVLFFPADELVAVELLDVEGDFKFERINTLISLINNDKKYIVVTNINGAIRKEMNETKWKDHILRIDKSTLVDEEKLIKVLSSMGYHFSYTVTKTGEYSRRGSIIDIFPLNYQNPIRIDLFGDEIDTIREFDLQTQKSIRLIDSFTILPVTELIYSEEEYQKALPKLNALISKSMSDLEKEKLQKDNLNLSLRTGVDNLLRYVNIFDDNPVTIFDLRNDKKVYLLDISKAEDTYNHMIDDLKEFSSNIGGYSIFELNYFKDFEYIKSTSDVICEGVVDYQIDGLDYLVSVPNNFYSNKDDILKYITKNYLTHSLIIMVKNAYRLDRLKSDLSEVGIFYNIIKEYSSIKPGQVNIVDGKYAPAFKSDFFKVIVLNEQTLFEIKIETRRPKYKSIYKNTTKISRYDELQIGDYVVHFDYGIGKYCGIESLVNQGILRDYLKIEYDGNDCLHIPVEQINKVEKYTFIDKKTVKLSKLGTKGWSLAKERARKKIQDISQNLIRLYARRQASVGFEALPDTNDQILFEADFGYELTLDQEKAIAEIKKEMESPRVMDRLVCGDVGYGKTEVAMRAAFKSVQSGKQVAILAPTTILSRQHYYTFKNRMERYGVRVELVNRMVSTKNLNKILADLERGSVDVVVGTHKLLGKDIKYKDLGLLVVDEEQRFGVLQKEKIKEIKINVDTLTLSATPIPRTLQMSMMGIKSLSMLETPPKNRYPIQTYVLERNDSIIRDSIMREIARGGQVFYMYNDTSNIESVVAHLSRLCPDARICYGHGKMDKVALENTITRFIDKEYDVLVCTTIIETGIDMPDANTLIVHRANLVGLSQLYQLRGRVGRSDKIAYAYLMYDPNSRLTDIASKRLETIKEFNELGSGFKIAMRDLAIRGAGDILGDDQSGFIETVGLETYLHILEEEIKNVTEPLKLKSETEIADPSLNMAYAQRSIPNDYINNEDVKIEIHKKINKIQTMEQLNELSDELRDRFGKYDENIKIYMYEKLMNKLCHRLGMKKILDTKSQMILFMSKEASDKANGNLMFELATQTSLAINLYYYNKQIEIIVDKTKLAKNEHLIILATFLDKLQKNS